MKRFIDVHTGEVMAGQGDVVLKSDTKENAVVIVAYDAAHKIGALAHALFVGDFAVRRHHAHRLREASAAIDEMIADMALLGADRDSIEVSLVVSETSQNGKADPKIEKSLKETLRLIRERKVRIKENFAGDNSSAQVLFDVGSGVISYS
jgi:chemotaxis receptor (MCP) glutamine deamidase CheD